MKKISLYVVIFTFFLSAKSFAQTDFAKMSPEDQGAYTAGYIKDHASELGNGDAVTVVKNRKVEPAPTGVQFQAADLKQQKMVPVTTETGDQVITYNNHAWALQKKNGAFYLGALGNNASNTAQNNNAVAQNGQQDAQTSPQQMDNQTAAEYYKYLAELERTKQKQTEAQLAAYQMQQQQTQEEDQAQQQRNPGIWGQSPTVWNQPAPSPWFDWSKRK